MALHNLSAPAFAAHDDTLQREFEAALDRLIDALCNPCSDLIKRANHEVAALDAVYIARRRAMPRVYGAVKESGT